MALQGIVARWITLSYLGWFIVEVSCKSLLMAKGEVLVMDGDGGVEIAVDGKIYRGNTLTWSVMKESDAETYLDNLPQ